MSVRAIRGAITVEENTKERILSATKRLLLEIMDRNSLNSENIIIINFSATPDLDAVYPAAAARELGLTNAALNCYAEINVAGSLEKCIRVCVIIDSDRPQKEMKHVYLEKARILRPDLAEYPGKYSIAIDGPAGAGKSTIAKKLAGLLNIVYIDTGAMYRAVALKAIRNNIDTKDAEKVSDLVKDISIRLEHRDNEQFIYLDGECVNDYIRTPEVSVGASNVAAIPAVRRKLVEIQREIASRQSVVMDGRDIGTYVLPDAECKVFLTASIEERARRRYKEQLEKGISGITLEDVMKDIEYRDKNDSSRSFAPLCKADDAILIDTTGLSIDEIVDRIKKVLEEKGCLKK